MTHKEIHLSSILETTMSFNFIQNLLQFFIVETTLQTWNQRFRFFCRLGTEITNGSKFVFVKLLLGEETTNLCNRLTIFETTETLRVVESFHEYFAHLLILVGLFVLYFSMLQQH